MPTRIARLCWNTRGWTRPSGRIGKSRRLIHEGDYGFGHEEWLFDTSKMLDGYHYGFLEPVHKFYNKYIGQTFDLLLYTHESEKATNYWVGLLRGVEVVDEDQGARAVKEYVDRGWRKEMERDLAEVGLDHTKFVNDYLTESEVINVRFRPTAMDGIFETPHEVSSDDRLITANRYILLHVPEETPLPSEGGTAPHYSFESGNLGDIALPSTTERDSPTRTIQAELRHNALSLAFTKYLQRVHGKQNVRRECMAYGGNRIDIVQRTQLGDVFYEVKTLTHPRTSIREAIGQLLDYCFFPEGQNAQKLVIVTDMPLDMASKKYMLKLQEVLEIPLGHIHFDANRDQVVKET